MSSPFSYDQAFSRNQGWVTAAEQQTLRCKTVAIAGMGGVGGVHLLTLARLGVSRFRIADFDVFELPNFNRQVGAGMSTVGLHKTAVLEKLARDINPELSVEVFSEGVGPGSVDGFLQAADLYVDGLDFFAFEARQLTFAACARLSIPAITAAPLGMGAALLNFMPGGMTFEQYFRWGDLDEDEKALRFLLGLAPAGLHRPYLVDPSTVSLPDRRGPSTIMGCQLCAGVAATEALKILLGRGEILSAPRGMQFDAYRNRVVRTWRPGGNNNPLQRLALAIGRRQLSQAHVRTRSVAPPQRLTGAESQPEGRATPSGSATRLRGDEFLTLVEAAVSAPSADNQHRFQCSLGSESINVCADKVFLDTREQHRRVLGLMAFGAVVENIVLRAADLGIRAEPDWFSPTPAQPLVARVRLSRTGNAGRDPLAAAITSRETNRRMYRGPSLTQAECAALEADALQRGGATLTWLSGQARKTVLKLVWQAESERFLRPALHAELFSSIRFDLPWNLSASTALPPGALEVEWPMRPLFRMLRHWGVMRAAQLAGAHHMLGFRAGFLPCWQAPGLGVLATAKPLEEGALAVGQAFERLWLRASLLGLALQPMAASAVLPLQGDDEGGASMALKAKLRAGWATVIPSATPLMVFRIGRASPPSLRAGRPDPAAFIMGGGDDPGPGVG